MKKNLRSADLLVKILLAVVIILFYAINIISGPFAQALAVIAGFYLLFIVVKYLVTKFIMD